MPKFDFNLLPNTDKVAIIRAIATETGMTPFAIEKDWWVSRTLEIIFQMPIAKHLVFKGGTSLSKAWKLINRFSEDIDLAIDREFFGIAKNELSKREITDLRKKAGSYSKGNFFTEFMDEFCKYGNFEGVGFGVMESKDSDQDPIIIQVSYPNVIPRPSEYVLPRVLIEIGCRSLREPFTLKSFGSLVDEHYPDKEFSAPMFQVPTVNPERTFLEKLFLLHEEFHKPIEKIRVERLSRHLYDVYHLTKAGIAEKAIHDKDLYETIVAYRHRFTKIGGVDYNSHNLKTLNPIPVPQILSAWDNDYTIMKDEMIYEENKPSFADLINNLNDLRTQLQTLDWNFELTFPVLNS
jgi:Nucleotidyl transferase AbiEii toxin, Type IV TA system